MKFIQSLLLSLFLLFSSVVFAADKSITLVMGEDSYPFQFIDDEGTPQGLLVELWKEWARVNRREVVFVARVWQDSLDQLADGRADVHIGMAANPSRETQFELAAPISVVTTYVYLHKDLSDRTRLEQLKPFQVGVVSGSMFEHELSMRVPGLTFKRYPTRESLLDAAQRGELVAFAGMEGYMRDQRLQQQLSAVFPTHNRILVRQTELHPALSKGNVALRREIDEGFANVSADVIRKIERRWLGYQREQSGLAIAMQLGVEPYVDIGVDGLPHGMYVDIWRLWSQKTGIPINFIPGDMNGSLEDVRSGKADVHIGYPESDDINTGLHRAWHMYTVKSRLFIHGEQRTDAASLKGKRIGIFPTAPYLAKVKAALPDTQLRFYSGMEEMLQAVQKGDIVGFVASAAWTQHYLLLNKSWAEFTQVPEYEYETDIFSLIRNGDEGLASRIASGFNMISPRELAEIEQKWILNSRDHVFVNVEKQLELSATERDYLKGLGTLKLGYLENWAPMEFRDPSGKFSGVNADVAAMMEQLLGISIEPVPFKEWSDLIAALKNGKIDLAGSVAKTPEREGQIHYSEPYWPSSWALLSPIGEVSAFNLEQIEGRRLAVTEGYQMISKLMAEHPGIKLVLVPDSVTGIEAVARGKADFYVDKVVVLASQLKSGQYQQFKLSLLTDFAEQYSHFGVSLRHGNFLPLLNKVIARLDKTKVQEIHSRWMNFELDTGAARYKNYLRTGVIALALLLITTLIVMVINRRLKAEIAAREKAEARIAHLASHDPLTQLPNRMLLDDRLNQSVLLHLREQAKFALLFVDLDGFKAVNDRFGHAVGDRLLVDVAAILENSLRKSDTVARFGGDEFVIVLNKIVDLDSVCQVAENLISRLSQPMDVGADTVRISASIGVAIFPSDGDNPIALLQKADRMMYLAKDAGGHGYRSS
ncbi:transporter substrate-binding domain-containing protein [Shewanella jiangmenensis]|uniref:transporter substrate-binding domain-containing protein n=1 Tax=Shewanella jiangmenensis TaxID=2837387 RepID=UPI00203259DE|nr:transporter substrate-binding domain-containing protein [Shewanella jiangmenensis]